MTAAIVSREIQDNDAALAADPIVIGMARGLAFVSRSELAHPDGTPRMAFSSAALDEYVIRRNGQIVPATIGSVARAVLSLLGA